MEEDHPETGGSSDGLSSESPLSDRRVNHTFHSLGSFLQVSLLETSVS